MPNKSQIAFRTSLDSARAVPTECLKLWKRVGGRPAFLKKFFKVRVSRWPLSIGPPSLGPRFLLWLVWTRLILR
jgi:hypothetical protein